MRLAGASYHDHEKLLEEFETFEDDLEVEQILKKVKAERVQDKSLAEQLEKREQRGGV